MRGLHGVAHAVGGIADHAHVFMGLRATHCLADVMRELKSESSKWIHRELQMPGFEWQEGYGAFSYSHSALDNVIAYIKNQKEHHKKQTFKDEYKSFLTKFQIDYKDEYLFEWLE